ncbi:MAG: hypothetical protein M9962_07935 [Oligoflexia bacterium]|nr:hypothetical protein [Oligoflexia bacterium]
MSLKQIAFKVIFDSLVQTTKNDLASTSLDKIKEVIYEYAYFLISAVFAISFTLSGLNLCVASLILVYKEAGATNTSMSLLIPGIFSFSIGVVTFTVFFFRIRKKKLLQSMTINDATEHMSTNTAHPVLEPFLIQLRKETNGIINEFTKNNTSTIN